MQNYFDNREDALLSEIVQNTNAHARFLNTLSFMELCGAKKLSQTIGRRYFSTSMLEHVAEEYRHAYFLRRLANKISVSPIDDYSHENVFCKRQSRAYISDLDRRVSIALRHHQELHNPMMCYLLVTYAIEQRALSFYKLYQEMLDRHGTPISVRSIISEELDHFKEMEQKLNDTQLPTDIFNACSDIEAQLFGLWVNGLAKELHCHRGNHP